jgi:hypothetical protein
MRLPTRLGLAAASVLLGVSACGGTRNPAAVPGPTDTAAVAGDGLVIRVEHTGGLVPAAELAGRLPLVSVYGDGRVIMEGPVLTIYPAPALPNLQQLTVAPAEVARLARRALDAGVGSATDFGRPSVTDLPDTRFTVTTGTGVRQSTVYALDTGPAGPDLGLTDAQRDARRKLTDLLDELLDPPAKLAEPGPYPVSSLAAVATAYRPPDPSILPAPPPVAWPGPPLPGDPVGADVGCVSVTGDAAKAVLTATAVANSATPWTSGGATWNVRFRPLLPDETACVDLTRR